MVGSVAIGLIAAFIMALLEEKVIIFDADPDMLVGIAVAPLQQQAALIFIKAPLTVEKIAVEAVQDRAHFALIDDLRGIWVEFRRCACVQVAFGNRKLA